MESINSAERKKIFEQELNTLGAEGYISDTIVNAVKKAHDLYCFDLINDKLEHNSPNVKVKTPNKKTNNSISKPESNKPHVVKKTLSHEEIRERNITWSLNIGVIFLLIGGLFVATSNWETMTSVMKSGLIAIVSFMFYGLALLTKKVLHIDKTAFAFIVLGNLFLPIFILSLGWFGLLGPFLSIDGRGVYYLGMVGSLVPVLIYVLFAKKLSSRLFVWFTYISVSAGAAFFFAALKLSIDVFYLGLIIFNAVIILLYHIFKQKDSIKLFTNEYVPFVQVNLVLCTLFMLFFYDSHLLYSINLLLTAIIYLSMIYVSSRKEYHFVFSVMIVYGSYQLIEHSILLSIGEILYACIAFGIVFVPKFLQSRFSLDKAFQFTSAIISAIAFIYISLEGIIFRAGSPSLVLMFAYFIIAANFIFLSHQGAFRLFPYLSSLFLATALLEAIRLISEQINDIHFPLYLFVTGILTFQIFGFSLLNKHLKIVQTSSKDVGLVFMAVGIFLAFSLLYWWELGVMLLLLVIIAYIVHKKDNRVYLVKMALWILPISLGLTPIAIGEEIKIHFPVYFNHFGYSLHFVVGTILVLLSSIIWMKLKEKELSRSSLILAQILYCISIVHVLIGEINHLWVIISLIIAVLVYLYSSKIAVTVWKKQVYLYGAFFSLFFLISRAFEYFLKGYSSYYEFPITSSLILILWIISEKSYKKYTSYFVVPFSIVGIICTFINYPYEWLPYMVTILYSIGLVVFLHKINWDLLGVIPLFFTFAASVEFSFFSEMVAFEKLLMSGGIGFLLVLIGQRVYKKMLENANSLLDIKIDFYTLISFLYFLFMYFFETEQLWTHILPGIMIAVVIWMQRNRVSKGHEIFIVIISAVWIVQPYYSLMAVLNVPALWEREAIVLPWVVLIIFVRIILKGKYSHITKPIEWGVLIIVSLLLIQDGLSRPSIYDAIILGTLSLLSMLSGMFFQIKSYFFIGSGVLLLNVFLQTRPYWGNMPWWGYLLIVGFILISVASFNEWNKQKSLKGKSTFFMDLKKKTIKKIKHWD